jgi:hypothetical protein
MIKSFYMKNVEVNFTQKLQVNDACSNKSSNFENSENYDKNNNSYDLDFSNILTEAINEAFNPNTRIANQQIEGKKYDEENYYVNNQTSSYNNCLTKYAKFDSKCYRENEKFSSSKNTFKKEKKGYQVDNYSKEEFPSTEKISFYNSNENQAVLINKVEQDRVSYKNYYELNEYNNSNELSDKNLNTNSTSKFNKSSNIQKIDSSLYNNNRLDGKNLINYASPVNNFTSNQKFNSLNNMNKDFIQTSTSNNYQHQSYNNHNYMINIEPSESLNSVNKFNSNDTQYNLNLVNQINVYNQNKEFENKQFPNHPTNNLLSQFNKKLNSNYDYNSNSNLLFNYPSSYPISINNINNYITPSNKQLTNSLINYPNYSLYNNFLYKNYEFNQHTPYMLSPMNFKQSDIWSNNQLIAFQNQNNLNLNYEKVNNHDYHIKENIVKEKEAKSQLKNQLLISEADKSTDKMTTKTNIYVKKGNYKNNIFQQNSIYYNTLLDNPSDETFHDSKQNHKSSRQCISSTTTNNNSQEYLKNAILMNSEAFNNFICNKKYLQTIHKEFELLNHTDKKKFIKKCLQNLSLVILNKNGSIFLQFLVKSFDSKSRSTVLTSLSKNIFFYCVDKFANRFIQVYISSVKSLDEELKICSILKPNFEVLSLHSIGVYILIEVLNTFSFIGCAELCIFIDSFLVQLFTSKDGLLLAKKYIQKLKNEESKVKKAFINKIDANFSVVAKDKFGHYGIIYLIDEFELKLTKKFTETIINDLDSYMMKSYSYKIIKKFLRCEQEVSIYYYIYAYDWILYLI